MYFNKSTDLNNTSFQGKNDGAIGYDHHERIRYSPLADCQSAVPGSTPACAQSAAGAAAIWYRYVHNQQCFCRLHGLRINN